MQDVFDKGQALRLLKASEGRKSPLGASGHTFLKHVGGSNEQLMQRLWNEGRNGKIAWFSAFENPDQAAEALALTLNLYPREVWELRSGKRSVFEQPAEIPRPFAVRFAFGGAGVQRVMTTRTYVALHATPAEKDFPYMVVTFFARAPDQIEIVG